MVYTLTQTALLKGFNSRSGDLDLFLGLPALMPLITWFRVAIDLYCDGSGHISLETICDFRGYAGVDILYEDFNSI